MHSLDGLRETLGARDGETVYEAAERVVRERDVLLRTYLAERFALRTAEEVDYAVKRYHEARFEYWHAWTKTADS